MQAATLRLLSAGNRQTVFQAASILSEGYLKAVRHSEPPDAFLSIRPVRRPMPKRNRPVSGTAATDARQPGRRRPFL